MNTTNHHYSMNLTLKDTNSDHTVTIDVNDGKLELSGDEVLYPTELQLVLCLTQALQHWLKGRYERIVPSEWWPQASDLPIVVKTK